MKLTTRRKLFYAVYDIVQTPWGSKITLWILKFLLHALFDSYYITAMFRLDTPCCYQATKTKYLLQISSLVSVYCATTYRNQQKQKKLVSIRR